MKGSDCASVYLRLGSILVLICVQCAHLQGFRAVTTPITNTSFSGLPVEIQCDIMDGEASVNTSWFINGTAIANVSSTVCFGLSGDRLRNLTILTGVSAIVSCGVPQDVSLAIFTLDSGCFASAGSFIENGLSACVAILLGDGINGTDNCLEVPSMNITAIVCCGTVSPNSTCPFGFCVSCTDYNTTVGFEQQNYTVVEGDIVEVCASLRGIFSPNFQLQLNITLENATSFGEDFRLPGQGMSNVLSLNATSRRQCFRVEALADGSVEETEELVFSLACLPSSQQQEGEVPVFINTAPATVVIQDLGRAVQEEFNNLEANVTMDNLANVVSTLSAVTNRSVAAVSVQTEGNVRRVASVFSSIASLLVANDSTPRNATTIENSTVQGLVETLSSLLRWQPQVLAVSASSIVRSFEAVAAAFADQPLQSLSVQISTPNIAFAAENRNTASLQNNGRSFSSTQESNGAPNPSTANGVSGQVPRTLPSSQMAFINLPPTLFNSVPQNRTNVGVFFAVYNNASLFPVADAEMENSSRVITVFSPVISATVGPGLTFNNLTPPVAILLRLRQLGDNQIVSFRSERCVSWDFNANGGRGNWTNEGCQTVSVENGVVSCRCNHLTNFAILVDICSRINNRDCAAPPALRRTLEVLTIIGVSLSLFGLTVTIITLTVIKKLRKRDASKYHVQLCIAMICMLLVFVTGVDRTEVYGGCVTVSVLIHYFTLVAVLWMVAEALLMFQKLVIVFTRITTRFIIIVSILCWVLPIIPVSIPLIVNLTRPNQDIVINRSRFCFLSHPGAFFGAFLCPIFVLLIFNTIIFIWVIVVLLRHTKADMQRQKEGIKTKRAIRLLISVSGVMFLFGLSWLFGALTLTVTTVNLLFQVLFVIFNSLQGFFIFLFFCVFSKEARESWKELLSCGRYKSEFLHPLSQSKSSNAANRNIMKRKTSSGAASTGLSTLSTSSAAKDFDYDTLSNNATLDCKQNSDIPMACLSKPLDEANQHHAAESTTTAVNAEKDSKMGSSKEAASQEREKAGGESSSIKPLKPRYRRRTTRKKGEHHVETMEVYISDSDDSDAELDI